jgi:hypothetical protein
VRTALISAFYCRCVMHSFQIGNPASLQAAGILVYRVLYNSLLAAPERPITSLACVTFIRDMVTVDNVVIVAKQYFVRNYFVSGF